MSMFLEIALEQQRNEELAKVKQILTEALGWGSVSPETTADELASYVRDEMTNLRSAVNELRTELDSDLDIIY